MTAVIPLVCWQAIEAIATVGAAIGTIAVAIFAIWGDYFRRRLAAPQLSLSLKDAQGTEFPRLGGGAPGRYFHLILKNRRNWSPATDVRVLVERIARRTTSGSFVLEPLVYPLPLAWTPSELRDFLRTVFDEEICDLGFHDDGSDRFQLSTLVAPSNVETFVRTTDAMRLRVAASGQNTKSRPLFLEIAWDSHGRVVVKEIGSL